MMGLEPEEISTGKKKNNIYIYAYLYMYIYNTSYGPSIFFPAEVKNKRNMDGRVQSE